MENTKREDKPVLFIKNNEFNLRCSRYDPPTNKKQCQILEARVSSDL